MKPLTGHLPNQIGRRVAVLPRQPQSGAMEPASAADYSYQTAVGLQHAHQKGLIQCGPTTRWARVCSYSISLPRRRRGGGGGGGFRGGGGGDEQEEDANPFTEEQNSEAVQSLLQRFGEGETSTKATEAESPDPPAEKTGAGSEQTPEPEQAGT